jgi:hypothetical protein
VSVVVILLAGFSVAAGASASINNELGLLLLSRPCCNGASLQGSRSYIQLPSSPSAGNLHQVLSTVGADDTILQVAQLGIQFDNNLVIDGDPNCFTPFNTLIGWYEWFDYVNFNTRCKSLGGVTTGHKYTVDQQANTNWQFYVDGNPQLASPLIQMQGTYAPNARDVKAGGEVAWSSTVSGPEPVNWQAIFGGNGNTPWQRFNNNEGWVTLSNNGVCNGGSNCTGGSWVFHTDSFPSTWSVTH